MSEMPQPMRLELYRFESATEARMIRHKAIADGLVSRGMCTRQSPRTLLLRLTEAGRAWLLDRGVKVS